MTAEEAPEIRLADLLSEPRPRGRVRPRLLRFQRRHQRPEPGHVGRAGADLVDGFEGVNLAGEASLTAVKEELAAALRLGWRAALPPAVAAAPVVDPPEQ